MKYIYIVCTLAVLMVLSTAHGKTIVVTTTNNVSPGAGQTNLIQAIQALEDGDTITFNIPGAGPHFLVTPPMELAPGGGGGYPEIKKNNVTIDGYSQPGASPNTNTILAANSAQLKIVLDSRQDGGNVWDISGYGTSEAATLLVSGNNVTVRGLSFLGVTGEGEDASPSRYAIALGNRGGNDFHLSGCWIGVAPDGKTVAGPKCGVTAFRHRDPTDVLTDRVVIGVKRNSTNPRVEFNVLVDMTIPVIIEGAETRISGNSSACCPMVLLVCPTQTPRGKDGRGISNLPVAYSTL